MFDANNWREAFTSSLLNTGRTYYENDKVSAFVNLENQISAIVGSRAAYSSNVVTIDKTGPDKTTFVPSCTCNYFSDHNVCRHVAAVMFEYENSDFSLELLMKELEELEKKNKAAKTDVIASTQPAQKKQKKRATSTKQTSAKQTAEDQTPIPISELYEASYDTSDNYYDVRRYMPRAKLPRKAIANARLMVERKKLTLDVKDIYFSTTFSQREYQLVHTFQGLFCAERTYRQAVLDREQERFEKELENSKNRSGWRYYSDPEPKYEQVRSEFRIPERADVSITGTPRKLLRAGCALCGTKLDEYSSEYNTPTVCIHILAALRLMDEYLYRYNPGDETDYGGERLLKMITQKRQGADDPQEAEKQPVIQIEPRISFNGDKPYLSFKLGTEKMYVLKELQPLVDACSAEDVYQLGKNNFLNFSRQTFTADAAPFYRMIEREAQAFEAFRSRLQNLNNYYGASELKLKGDIPLEGNRLDEIFDIPAMLSPEGIPVRTAGSEKNAPRFYFRDGGASLPVYITPEEKEERFAGVRIRCDLSLLTAGKNCYYLYDPGFRSITRLTEGAADSCLTDLVSLQNTFHQVDVRIGKKHLSRFFYRTLPTLNKDPFLKVQIEQLEMIGQYLQPEPQLTFYLDAEDGAALCRGLVQYEDIELPLRHASIAELPLPTYRDLSLEEAALKIVESYFMQYNEDSNTFSTDGSGDALYTLLENGVTELMSLGTVHATDAFDQLHIRKTPPVRIGVRIDGNLLDLQFQTEDISPQELQELLLSYRLKKRYHKLNNGNFVQLTDNDALETLDQLLATMGVSPWDLTNGEMKLPLFRALYLNKMLEEHDEIACDRERTFRKLIRDFRSIKDSDFDVPESLNKIMRSYQVTGYKWMRTLAEFGFGGILADDMGLGKTLQMISVFAALKSEGQLTGTTSLIICPASLIYNWQEEIHRFAPELTCTVIAGTTKAREKLLEQSWEDSDILITSYDLLKRDVVLYQERPLLYEVLDEAQYIKNPKSAAAKSVKILQSQHRFSLTGTPIENQLSELWSIFDYLMPGFLYDYNRFHTELETPIVKNQESDAAAKLKQLVSPFILRRLKTDVLRDLPDKLEEVRYAKFDKTQQKLYDAQLLHMKQFLATADEKDKIKILAEITKIRQICCDPSLLFENYAGESAKRQAAVELIQSAIDSGHKILLFSQFTSMLELLEGELKAAGISYFKITGAIPKEERLSLVHRFNEDDTPLFLISLKAGGTGLNLTGADVVIHYDPWWNLAAQNQATDRAHRIGQTNKVTVYKLIVKGTIEERIMELQNAKADLADAIISGENTSLASLSKEELEKLLLS